MSTTDIALATSPANVMELFAERAAAGDLEGLMDLYEVDALMQPQFGVTLVGQEQIRMATAEFLQLQPRIAYSAAPDVLITGDLALVSNFWTMKASAPDGTEITDGGTSADVVRRQSDGSWKILIDQPRGNPSATLES
jgi:uncharacterized protein (TIGR02246 family)